jgi:formylmethanofuran dehydrogenase subunit E
MRIVLVSTLHHALPMENIMIEYEVMIRCSRCEEPTPESELLKVHAWWVCGICYDDL